MSSVPDRDVAERLRLALAQRGMSLLYQPKIAVATGALSGVEAVCRWHDSELGDVPPDRFVLAAEQFGLIDSLTSFVLAEAIAQWRAWKDQGIVVGLAVNVSALSLGDRSLPDRIQRLCMREGMPCERLTIEVTESATQAMTSLLETMTRFRLKGFSVSLDDFGTGYSSLAQLRRLPFSEIKIDRCFVADAAVSRESRLIVKATVDLAHALGLGATAEGVEDAETLKLLDELGCDEAQGFLIARPMPGSELVGWLLGSGRHVEGMGAADPAVRRRSGLDAVEAASLAAEGGTRENAR